MKSEEGLESEWGRALILFLLSGAVVFEIRSLSFVWVGSSAT